MNGFKIYLLTIILCLPTMVAISQDNSSQTSISNEQDGNIFHHTVERGETIYAISTMYNVSEEDIYRLNPTSREYIKIGQVLKIPQKISSENLTKENLHTYHTIQAGETLYGISRRYNVHAEAIIKANPGLSIETFLAGKTIRIPATEIESLPTTKVETVTTEMEYTIKKKETIYRICKNFHTTSDELIRLNPELRDGLKEGMVIKVPVKKKETVTTKTKEPNEYDINALISFRKGIEHVNVAKIALLLPFHMKDSNNSSRIVEYYEGFLLAVDSMKKIGVSIDLSVFDIGDGIEKTQEALNNKQLAETNLIIGGVTNEQIELIAKYAQKHEIKYVIPLSSKSDHITSSNAYVFQINTPHTYLYSLATMKACSLFVNYNVILVNTGDKEQKTEFIQRFKADMAQKNIPYQQINFNEKTFRKDITAILSTTKPNVIIPLSSSIEALSKIKGPLRMLAEKKPAYKLTLFGYPEWQTYTSECLDDFFALNTYIYTPFFANNMSPQVQHFNDNYRRWYKKNMSQTFPKYTMLGFDTGMFFMGALNKYGINFEDYIWQMQYHSLQTGLRFDKRMNNWGGFMNMNIYMVHYNKDLSIIRTK